MMVGWKTAECCYVTHAFVTRHVDRVLQKSLQNHYLVTLLSLAEWLVLNREQDLGVNTNSQLYMNIDGSAWMTNPVGEVPG